MSAQESKSVVLSSKLKKEIEKFFEWASESYVVKWKDDDEKEWAFDLVKKFEEPSRNKLEMYIKAIMENHSITDGQADIIIDDAKLLAKDFKENGKVKKKEVKETIAKPEKQKKKTNEKKETPKRNEKEDKKIVIDDSLDTTRTWYLVDIDSSTNELEEILGCPATKTGKKGDSHRYEWKFEIDGNVYSIYDWAYTDDSFDDYNKTQWHLAGNTEDLSNIDTIRNILKSKQAQENRDLFGEDLDDNEEIDFGADSEIEW
jgi:hypothetical protein